MAEDELAIDRITFRPCPEDLEVLKGIRQYLTAIDQTGAATTQTDAIRLGIHVAGMLLMHVAEKPKPYPFAIKVLRDASILLRGAAPEVP